MSRKKRKIERKVASKLSSSSLPIEDNVSSQKLIDQNDESVFIKPCSVILYRLTDEEIHHHCTIFEQDNFVPEPSVNMDENDQFTQKSSDLNSMETFCLTPEISQEIKSNLIQELQTIKKEPTILIFCLFCLEEFTDPYKALLCYYRDLKYYPLKCGECDEVTLEGDTMFLHYENSHPRSQVLCKLNKIESKEKWVKKILNYQISCINEVEKRLPHGLVHKYCPLCNQFDFKLSNSNLHSTSGYIEVLDKNHVFKHLRYNPFECKLCATKGKRFALSVVNLKAKNHLINRHGIQNPTEKELIESFSNNGVIPELDRYINRYIKIMNNQLNLPATSNADIKKRKASTKSIKIRKKLCLEKEIPKKTYSKTNSKTLIRQVEKDKKIKKEKIRGNENVVCNFSFNSTNNISDHGNNNTTVCFFCGESFHDIYIAWSHLAFHLSYNPIECTLCGNRYPNHESFRYHGSLHPDIRDLPFIRRCDSVLEKWGREYVGKSSYGGPEWAAFCPLCEKIFTKPMEIAKFGRKEVFDHVYAHLQYYPYECLKCGQDEIGINSTYNENGVRELIKRVTRLESDGIEHLQKDHGLEVKSDEVESFFLRSGGIKEIDKFLDAHFDKIQYLLGTDEVETNQLEMLYSTLEKTLGQNALNSLFNTVTTNASSINPSIDTVISVPNFDSSMRIVESDGCDLENIDNSEITRDPLIEEITSSLPLDENLDPNLDPSSLDLQSSEESVLMVNQNSAFTNSPLNQRDEES